MSVGSLAKARLIVIPGGGSPLAEEVKPPDPGSRCGTHLCWDSDVLHADPRLRVQPGLRRVDDLDPTG